MKKTPSEDGFQLRLHFEDSSASIFEGGLPRTERVQLTSQVFHVDFSNRSCDREVFQKSRPPSPGCRSLPPSWCLEIEAVRNVMFY